MDILQAIELLKAYNGPFKLTLHAGANEELIKKFENTYGIVLPADFKTLYCFTNGLEIDEDIFNMIPLTEIIDNKKEGEPIWFAEYMIYSDMWALEINPENPNDYTITCVDYSFGKIDLTKSLGDFINRFFKGGVFEIGGLYAWKDEIKAKLFGNTDPDKMKPALWVFRECLKRGLMSKEEMIEKADWIIATEENPDYFFIEMSLSRSLDDLVTLIDSIQLTDDVTQVRAFFATVHSKILINQISLDKVISILESFSHYEGLTKFEKAEMIYLIVEWDYLVDTWPQKSQEELNRRIEKFLYNYNVFNYHDYRNWERVNEKIEAEFQTKTL